ncbi:glycosyltransferase [Polaribacter porphyrae]|uniref:Glycosyl transferase group 1 n=1 Tax=Polaribacter porphyrae TaxID=1137780 RepID=A0A2S7WKE8_9FLAO|nr:glycosyltransferase [Polaribacter porphyrae]PQJ77772.1 glycosyl transferase group 1 [Polaribacter porphyrae]
MKILFVCSGNSVFGVSPITKNQGNSINKSDDVVYYFPIIGKGVLNYIKNIFLLKKHLLINKYDIVHAHYSSSAFVAALANAKPLVVSLMGSDVQGSYLSKLAIKFLYKLYCKNIIVKSTKMLNSLGFKNISVIPNGVNLEIFYSMNKRDCQKQLGWDYNKKHILFAANPLRPEKNFRLAKQAFSILNNGNIVLHSLNDVSPKQMPLWMNSADVVLLVSLWEGSPNVIKEAMACNRPIVSTDVGDIRWLLNGMQGCCITSYDPEDVAKSLKISLEFSENKGQTKGREKIIELGLDSKTIAKRIMSLYKSVLIFNEKKCP